ncbi:tetratricopeptide repeat protein [Fulvivirga sp. 29W222]|uniref:Tetratricopeptide repeat protein n=1 Tax=Fulvivirga marina TaxID=2494733 RepID=A0A937G1V7_9BACT|nr:tetratricopeptide repeat protein [Fulvivirga marina]MBL6448963.1 tetratricopeptide repeat protein [Fulvivirga marina]
MPRLATLAVLSMLFITACTQDEIYTHDPAKIEALEHTYQEYLNHYKDSKIAFELLEKLRTLAIELDNKEYLAKYYDNHGYLNRKNDKNGEAIKSYKLAMNLYSQLKDSLKMAKMASNIGNAYRVAERPLEALKYHERAENIYIQLNEKQKLPLVYDNLSLVYLALEEFDKAEYHISKSLEASIVLESSFWIYNAYASYGELYFRQQRFDEAIKNYEKALTYLNDNQELEKAFLHGNIGESYMNTGELSQAEKWLNEALQIKTALDDADKRPNLNYLAELASLKGDYKAALKYYDQVVELSVSDKELLSEELSTALEALQTLSNNPSARAAGLVVSSQKYSLIRDKKNKLLEEQNELISSMYAQQSVDMAEAEITHLNNEEKYKHELLQKEQRADLMNIVYAISAALGLLLLVFVLYKYRKRLIMYRNYKNQQERKSNKLEKLHERLEEEVLALNQQVHSIRQMLRDSQS